MQLDDNPTRLVRKGTCFLFVLNKGLVEFLKAIPALFAVSLDEMPHIDPGMVCNQLNIDLTIYYVAQHRRKQSRENPKATMIIFPGQLDTNFIFEVIYT